MNISAVNASAFNGGIEIYAGSLATINITSTALAPNVVKGQATAPIVVSLLGDDASSQRGSGQSTIILQITSIATVAVHSESLAVIDLSANGSNIAAIQAHADALIGLDGFYDIPDVLNVPSVFIRGRTDRTLAAEASRRTILIPSEPKDTGRTIVVSADQRVFQVPPDQPLLVSDDRLARLQPEGRQA